MGHPVVHFEVIGRDGATLPVTMPPRPTIWWQPAQSSANARSPDSTPPDSLAAGRPVALPTMTTMADGIAVASPGELTLAHCAELVDEVKKRLPIWKRQVFTDGEEEWVACP